VTRIDESSRNIIWSFDWHIVLHLDCAVRCNFRTPDLCA
jgi:hypothetical protein